MLACSLPLIDNFLGLLFAHLMQIAEVPLQVVRQGKLPLALAYLAVDTPLFLFFRGQVLEIVTFEVGFLHAFVATDAALPFFLVLPAVVQAKETLATLTRRALCLTRIFSLCKF